MHHLMKKVRSMITLATIDSHCYLWIHFKFHHYFIKSDWKLRICGGIYEWKRKDKGRKEGNGVYKPNFLFRLLYHFPSKKSLHDTPSKRNLGISHMYYFHIGGIAPPEDAATNEWKAAAVHLIWRELLIHILISASVISEYLCFNDIGRDFLFQCLLREKRETLSICSCATKL